MAQHVVRLLVSPGNGKNNAVFQRFRHPTGTRTDAATNSISLLKIRVVSVNNQWVAKRNSVTQHKLMHAVPFLGIVQKVLHPSLVLDVAIQFKIRTLVDFKIKFLVSRFVLAKSTGLRGQDGREQHKQQHGQAD